MIFLFNVGGYYLVFWGVRTQAKKDLLHRLDADQYSSEDLVVLSIPVNLPYPIQQNGYERVDGEFEYGGEYYNLVKQRLQNDTLVYGLHQGPSGEEAGGCFHGVH